MDKELIFGVFVGVLILFGGGFAVGYHAAVSDSVVDAYSKEVAKQASWYATE